ncbi:MAG: SH3 domain-containing protein [Defluviitaleaceae bacterium]|nr:SH3 domain-containing protein [Defluviitaleaceae bacterium]
MSFVQNSFEWAGELYGSLFADWLHVHFLLRTILILLVSWLFVFLLAQLVKYALAPGILMFFYHVIFRAWNFLFVETPHEWLYIRHHEEPGFPERYLRLCDCVKQNRIILEHTRFKGMLHRSQKFSTWFMITCAIGATLWVSAFGLHHEYVAPTVAIINEAEIFDDDVDEIFEDEELFYTPVEIPPAPAYWDVNTIFALNEQGREGARLRGGPGIDGQTILEILWDDAQLIFLGEYVSDTYVNGMYWLRVETTSGTVGYISSMMLEEVLS